MAAVFQVGTQWYAKQMDGTLVEIPAALAQASLASSGAPPTYTATATHQTTTLMAPMVVQQQPVAVQPLQPLTVHQHDTTNVLIQSTELPPVRYHKDLSFNVQGAVEINTAENRDSINTYLARTVNTTTAVNAAKANEAIAVSNKAVMIAEHTSDADLQNALKQRKLEAERMETQLQTADRTRQLELTRLEAQLQYEKNQQEILNKNQSAAYSDEGVNILDSQIEALQKKIDYEERKIQSKKSRGPIYDCCICISYATCILTLGICNFTEACKGCKKGRDHNEARVLNYQNEQRKLIEARDQTIARRISMSTSTIAPALATSMNQNLLQASRY